MATTGNHNLVMTGWSTMVNHHCKEFSSWNGDLTMLLCAHLRAPALAAAGSSRPSSSKTTRNQPRISRIVAVARACKAKYSYGEDISTFIPSLNDQNYHNIPIPKKQFRNVTSVHLQPLVDITHWKIISGASVLFPY